MTWVVGGRHAFCARAMSDIQATISFSSGKTLYVDGVKKVHELSDRVVILFAGDIRLALSIIACVRDEFMSHIDPRLHNEPKELMKKIRKAIIHYYKKCRESVSAAVEFLVLISPNGIMKAFGLWKLCSPYFELVEAIQPFEMLQIGSGSRVNEYADIVGRHSSVGYEVSNGNGEKPTLIIPVGRVALEFVFKEALSYRNAGISGAMHITLLTHQGAVVREFGENPAVPFPNVASSWPEFKALCKQKGTILADAVATA